MVSLELFEEKAEILKALGHPVRLCIVTGLLQYQCNVTKMQQHLNLPQSTVSQHLSILKSKGIIKGQRSGLEICYSVVDEDVKKIVEILVQQPFEIEED